MHKIVILLALICLNLQLIRAEQEYVYTIHYVKSFRHDLFEKYMGCSQKNIAYSTYIHPVGPIDALQIYLNPGTYQRSINCNTRNLYVKLFGSGQNYQQLLQSDPSTVVGKVVRGTSRGVTKFIIDWKYPLLKDIEKSRVWLNKLVEAFNNSNIEVYVKAPASYFCYANDGHRYLLDLDKPKKFIIQMYGQQSGVYTTYEQMFQKQQNRQISNAKYYKQQKCPKFPSYKTLTQNFPGKQFFIQKTLLKQEAGYIGPRFSKFLQKGKSIYGKIAFLDSFPQQIIQL